MESHPDGTVSIVVVKAAAVFDGEKRCSIRLGLGIAFDKMQASGTVAERRGESRVEKAEVQLTGPMIVACQWN